MTYYFDTSALVKYFFDEPGSRIVTQIIRNEENQVVISELALVELVSSTHTKFRTKQISAVQLDQAIGGYKRSLESFYIEPLSTIIRQEAERLLISYGSVHALRTLDSLQLASFRLINEPHWIFVASDERLLALASDLGHTVLNPALD